MYVNVNIKKTKEMEIDFRSRTSSPQPTSVKGQIVEWASRYKYLGLIIDNKLRFDTHVEAVCKKKANNGYTVLGVSLLLISVGLL